MDKRSSLKIRPTCQVLNTYVYYTILCTMSYVNTNNTLAYLERMRCIKQSNIPYFNLYGILYRSKSDFYMFNVDIQCSTCLYSFNRAGNQNDRVHFSSQYQYLSVLQHLYTCSIYIIYGCYF